MDRATLSWIACNRPTGPGIGATLPHRPLLLVPDDSWFARAETVDSIHGARHGARVAVLVQLLAPSYGLGPARATALAAGAACHDVAATTTATTPATADAPPTGSPISPSP
ncbi:hypothetical protein [Kitasatospora sp. RG8]|uniref:hypothetical protein n=1 Tax=Kitasatospora sp. RG8 TaxID=2820815 RepID=UPI001FD78B48|nr:hypothetical protein [Kitasatospora sp. RG8]